MARGIRPNLDKVSETFHHNATELSGEYPFARKDALEPPPELAVLRNRRPLSSVQHLDGRRSWLATSYSLIRSVLNDPRFSVSAPTSQGADSLSGAPRNPLSNLCVSTGRGGLLLDLDGAQHAKLRRLHTGYFTIRRVGELRPNLEEIVSRCLAQVEAAGPPVDLVGAFAFPLHSLVVCEVLGLPHSDADWLEQRGPSVVRDRDAGPAEVERAMLEYIDYFRRVIDEKRVRPANDVLSGLCASGELSDAEIIVAASEMTGTATANTIALAVLALLAERERWEALTTEPTRIDAAVEELLRYVGAFQVVRRTALEDVELNGELVAKGDVVILSLVGANHDPDQFADPERLDFNRNATGQVAFGYGRHICVAQHLARVELKTAVSGLTGRFPTLRLAVPIEQVEMYGPEHAEIYGLKSLPVEW